MTTASARVTIVNELGLHARPASLLAETAGRFASDVSVARTDNAATADAKSMMSLLTLVLTCGTELEISATGDDAETAVARIVELVESRFGLE